MRKMAVTGGISSGKSTVCRFFAELGAYVVSADAIVHDLLASKAAIRTKITSLIGPNAIINNQVDRKVIAERAFSNPEVLKSLELILHPLVFYEIQKRYEAIKNDPKYNLFLVEIPLLYETQTDNLFDSVLVVSTHKDLCKTRFQKSNSEKNFEQRFVLQLPLEEKEKRADFVLFNNGSLENLKKEVKNKKKKKKKIFFFLKNGKKKN